MAQNENVNRGQKFSVIELSDLIENDPQKLTNI